MPSAAPATVTGTIVRTRFIRESAAGGLYAEDMPARIGHVALIFLFGFLVLTAGASYWQVIRGEDLNSRPSNPRVAELSAREERGTIWSADGVALARSERGQDNIRRRIYRFPSLAHTIGYVSIRYGVSGLEERYAGELGGARAGDALAQLWRRMDAGTLRGDDLVLTVDTRIQEAAAQALGDRPGAVVALDPKTGAVLAMVSSPTFDPNRLAEEGEALINDPGMPLINRAIQGEYAPGSVFKTITAAAGLETDAYQQNSRFTCVNALVVQGFVIPCKGPPPGVREYDFAHAYAWSVNATFAEIGLRVGGQELAATARRMGFDERIPFDLPVAESHLLRSGSAFDEVLLANTAFGQGQLSVTPLQMALVAAAVANNGTIMQPYIVSEVRGADGSVRHTHQARAWRQAITPQTAAALRGFMVTAVREGFGAAAAVPGIQVGGKTGTAETGADETHAWFTAIAPAEDPRIVVAVIVENAGQGSSVAAPIAASVIASALKR